MVVQQAKKYAKTVDNLNYCTHSILTGHANTKNKAALKSSFIIIPTCALIIFADKPIYQTYSDSKTWINALPLCATPSSYPS